MAIVTYLTSLDKAPIRHYAQYTDQAAIATLVPGGYMLRLEDGTRKLAAHNDPQLILLGRCDIADAKRAEEEAAGGLAAIICGYGAGGR
jgi:hypothetical protein